MELTVDQKIKYADIIARVMICASVIFIGYGSVVRIMQDGSYGNQLMIVGLVFVALFGVSVYTKRKLVGSVESGKTFHG